MYGLHNDASATRASLTCSRSAAEPVFAPFGVFLVNKVLWFDGHVNDIGGIMVEFRVWPAGVSGLAAAKGSLGLPFSGALSSSNFPNEINRIELGLDGFGSHSVLPCQCFALVLGHVSRHTVSPLS